LPEQAGCAGSRHREGSGLCGRHQPHIFLYDLVILAVAMAFLLCARGAAGPTPGEMRALAIAGFLVVIFPLVKAPTGLAATLGVTLLIIRRAGLMPARLGSSSLRA
jgi:hypothetical protein